MGQTLANRPISQRSSFATLGTGSSANAPDQSQYQGSTTPPPSTPDPTQQMNGGDAQLQSFQLPTILGTGQGFMRAPFINGGRLPMGAALMSNNLMA